MDSAHDKKTGISIRFIKEYKPETFVPTTASLALELALFPVDEDDIRTFPERLADAYAYLREQNLHIH